MTGRGPDLTGHQSAAAFVPALFITVKLGWLALVLVGRTIRFLARVGFVLVRVGCRLVLRICAPQRAARDRRARWYRKHWADNMVKVGLGWKSPTATHVPELVAVEIGDVQDRLTIRPLGSQHAGTWARDMPAVAIAYGARQCKVSLAPDHAHLFLDIAHGDLLAEPVGHFQDVLRPFDSLPIGLREDGTPWYVTGPSILVAGTTGSGKGSVLWSLIWAMCPMVEAGTAELWVVDPKFGVELSPGRSLFHRYEDGDLEEIVSFLEDARDAMRARGRAQQGRVHVPSEESPLIMLIVDELAALTALKGTKELTQFRDRAVTAMGEIARMGRAVGFWLVAAVQDPRVEAVPFRASFHTTVGLRLREADHVDMVLGPGARAQGALCDQIPPDQPGVVFAIEGGNTPVRARACYMTDRHIQALVDNYGRRPLQVVGEAA